MIRTKVSVRWFGVLAAITGMSWLTQPARAATYTWDPNGNLSDSGGTWTTSAGTTNWYNSSADTYWTNGSNVAAFGSGSGGTTSYTVTLGSNITAGGLIFNNQDYAIAPDASNLYSVTLGAGGITANASATVNTPLALSASQTWTAASGQTLTVAGSIAGAGNVLAVGGAGNTTVSAPLTTTDLDMVGSGTLDLSGVGNSIGGKLNAAGGTLELIGNSTTTAGAVYVANSEVAGGGNGTLNIKDSAVLNITGSSAGFYLGNQGGYSGTVNQSGGTVNATFVTGANNGFRIGHWPSETSGYNLSGGLLNVPNATVYVGWDGTGQLNVSGGTAALYGLGLGNGHLESGTGFGTLNLSGGLLQLGAGGLTFATGYAAVNLSSGTLQLGDGSSGQDGSIQGNVTNNAALAYDLFGSQTYSGVISGNGTLTKLGAGVLKLSGTNTYTGGTTVNGGTLNLNVGGGTGTICGVLTVNPGGNATLNTTDALGYTVGANVTTVNINAATIDNAASGNNGYRTNFNLAGGTMSSTGGGTYNFTSGYGVTTYASTATLLISSGITVRDSSNMLFSVASGTTASGIDLGVSGMITGTGGIVKNGPGAMVLSGTCNYTGATTISGGTLQIGNGTTDGSISSSSGIADNAALVYNVVGSQSCSNVISGNGTLTKLGAGTLTLTNTNTNNTYSGGTVVNGGTLVVNANLLNNGTGLLGSGTLTINAGATVNTYVNSFGYNVGGLIPVVINGGVLNQLGSVAGPDSHLGPLAMTGGTVSGTEFDPDDSITTNAASATAVISAGTLNLQTTVLFTVAAGAVSPDLSVSSVISGGSLDCGITKNGPGTMLVSGPSTYSGGTTVNAGTLIVANSLGSASGSGNVTLNGGTLASGPVGTIAGSVTAGTSAHVIAPGGVGSFGTLAVGSLTTGSNLTTLNFDLGSPVSNGTYTGDLIMIGSGGLSLSPSTNVAFNNNPSGPGDYRLLGGNLGSPMLTNLLLPSPAAGLAYSLSTTADAGFLDLVVQPGYTNANYTLTATAASHTIIAGGSTAVTAMLANTGGTAGAPDSIAYTGLTATGSTVSGLPTSGTVAANAAASNGNLTFTSSTAGSYTITPAATTVSGVNGTTPNLTATNTDTVNVVDHASGSVSVLAGNGFLSHVGATGPTATIALSNAPGARSDLEVNAAPTAGSTGLTIDLATPCSVSAGSCQTFTATFSTPTAGNYSNSLTFASLSDNQLLPGATALGSIATTISGSVFSGTGTWNSSGGTAWSASANWTDANGVQAAPGTFAGFSNTDSAIFSGSGQVTSIDLTAANPSLESLSFSGSNYTLSGGSLTLAGASATVVVSGGTQTIASAVTLASSVSIAPAGGTQLTVSGDIGGSEALLLTDAWHADS